MFTFLTYDEDFIIEGVRRQKAYIHFHGIIFAHPTNVSIGDCVNDLEFLAKAGSIDGHRQVASEKAL